MDVLLIGFFGVVLLFGLIVFILIATRGAGRSQLDVDKFRSEWLKIEGSIVSGNEASYHLAVLNADKLLDRALKERGFKGQTMGDRMKSANSSWSSANNVWTAHKLRNQIAHETSVNIQYDTTMRVLSNFKQALKDMRAI